MNLQQAVIQLLKHSIVFSSNVKVLLLKELPTMDDARLRALGRSLAAERELVLRTEDVLLSVSEQLVDMLATTATASSGDQGRAHPTLSS